MIISYFVMCSRPFAQTRNEGRLFHFQFPTIQFCRPFVHSRFGGVSEFRKLEEKWPAVYLHEATLNCRKNVRHEGYSVDYYVNSPRYLFWKSCSKSPRTCKHCHSRQRICNHANSPLPHPHKNNLRTTSSSLLSRPLLLLLTCRTPVARPDRRSDPAYALHPHL